MRTLRACAVVAALLSLLVGCAGSDAELIRPSGAPPDDGNDGGMHTAGTGGDPTRDGALPEDAGDADSGGDSGLPTPDRGCRPNPEPTVACPQICDETCNGQDDDCDGDIDEGSATDLCDVPHATALCQDGECLLVECDERYRNCDGRPSNGCEASLDDVATCGSCNTSCDIERAIEGCEDGECVPIGCEPGYDDCDDDVSTTCETEVVTAEQCGACDYTCELDHALSGCEDLACEIVLCDGGYDDCDRDPETGCEAPLDTLEDCGACGTTCELASCAGGVCSAILCTAPEADCNADGVDCEVDLANDPDNCGACNAACTFGEGAAAHADGLTCIDRRCAPLCDPGYGDCDPDFQNGCETRLNSLEHCGSCGRACDALLEHTSATGCTDSGQCVITSCDPGYEDCDGEDSTGCETNVRSVDDCGGCASSDDNETCSGLTRATETSCDTGVCQIDQCEAGYDDCDGDAANGCEHHSAVEGACAPDTNCTRFDLGTSKYFFCTNDSTWNAARDKCLVQTRGDLVHIDDSAENAFVLSHRTGDAWIGASDAAREGTWRWSSDGVPFWRGAASGQSALSQYENWADGEPNDSGGNEDCAEIWVAGTWNDQTCGVARDFVCEVSSDLCPDDASKHDPGQCGCGMPDTDSDDDGFATCNDACPSDPQKLAAGTCGCGTPDTNSDGDTQPDCSEQCDDDPMKLVPGACGCGVAETDTDADGTPNCNDGCPLNASSIDAASSCGLGFAPPNIDVTRLNPNQADATTTLDCAAVLNTSDPPSFTTWCSGALPQITVHSQASGPELVVVAFRGLSIPATRSLTIVGSRPAALVVFGDATIAGTLDASASGTTARAGGNYSCTPGAGANAPCGGLDNETGGGGGGGFFTAGGRGGSGDDCSGGNGGSTRGNAALVPLFGGCRGGYGGGCASGGAGGGAVQLTASGSLTVSGTIRANGGVGPGGCSGQRGGGGGGSGGAIRLDAASLTTTGATIQTNGGRGGSADGTGGNGSTSSSSPGSTGGNSSAAGGGGGGGGYGRVVTCNRTTSAGCP